MGLICLRQNTATQMTTRILSLLLILWTTTGTAFAQQPVKHATAEPPEGYRQAASENGRFDFKQVVDVAYGSNGHFVYKKGVSGVIIFNNASFGDPRPGYPKYGFYRLPSTPETAQPASAEEVKLPEGVRGRMYFRYKDQVTYAEEFNDARLRAGDRVYVIPGQSVKDEFLEKRMGQDRSGSTFFGKTGITFDPKAPKVCGRTFRVASVDAEKRTIRFTEPFPENISNAWNNSFVFEVILVR